MAKITFYSHLNSHKLLFCFKFWNSVFYHAFGEWRLDMINPTLTDLLGPTDTLLNSFISLSMNVVNSNDLV